jgi:hypothetical protein
MNDPIGGYSVESVAAAGWYDNLVNIIDLKSKSINKGWF